jgi:hypothetical protein
MHPALWLLLRLRSRARWRRFLKSLQTVRGALLLIVAVGFFGLMFLSSLVTLMVGALSPDIAKMNRQMVEASIPYFQTLGPLVLLVLILLSVASNWGETAIYFTPADVDFLFAAPFSRRELLYYKLIQSIRTGVIVGTIFALVAVRYTPLFAAAWLGSVLTLLFLNAVTLSVTLLSQTVSARAFTRWRQAALGLIVAALALAAGQALPHFNRNNLLASLEELRASIAGQVLFAPLEVFPRILTAHSYADLALWSSLAALMVLGLFGVALALDVNYLETAQQVSQRVYARLQRRRQAGGGVLGDIQATQRLGVPRLPWLWGVGPNLWRQWLLLLRRSRGLIVLVVVIAILGVWLVMTVRQPAEKWPYAVPAIVLGVLAYQSLLASMQLPAGFRGDLDRLEWLKSLPIHPAAIAWSEVGGSVLVLSALQAATLLAFWAFHRDGQTAFLIGLIALAPFNLLLFGVENMVFLIFPMRLAPTTAGDFQFMGKMWLLVMFKFLVLFVALAVAAAGAIVYLLVPSVWLAAATSLALLVAIDICVLQVATVAFRHFDVSRDVPPG